MAREKKPVHKVQMTEGKRNIIHQLLATGNLSDVVDHHVSLVRKENLQSSISKISIGSGKLARGGLDSLRQGIFHGSDGLRIGKGRAPCAGSSTTHQTGSKGPQISAQTRNKKNGTNTEKKQSRFENFHTLQYILKKTL